MPPPPVAGAAVGNGLADGLGVGDGVGVGVGVGVGDGVGDGGRLAGGLGLSVAELLAGLPDEVAGVGEAGPAGENEVGPAAEGEDPVQAETAAETSTVMVVQPMMANLALSPAPAMVVRTFMEPPHASGGPHARIPAPDRRRKGKRELAAAGPAGGSSPETAAAIKIRPADGTATP